VADSARGLHGYIAPMAEHPTLFDWAGGRYAFDRMIDAFYDRVEQDAMLSPFSQVGSTRNTVAMSLNGGVRSSEVPRPIPIS
jgi:hypothetical protein